MRLNILAMFSALLFVAACATGPESSKEGEGTGASTGDKSKSKTTTTVTPAPAPAQPKTQAAVPKGPKPGSRDEFVYNVGDRVHFDYDKFDIKPASRDTLQLQAAWLKKWPAVTATVEGHCDERGTREYNLALGERRAQAVKDYLVSLGVDAARVSTISYGKERPEALGQNEESWAKNRRGVTSIN